MKVSKESKLDLLMNPRSIAVVGASPKGNRGSTILRNLQRFRFPGKVFVVHPKYSEVEGYPCYPSAEDLPEAVDFVALAVPAEAALDQVGRFGAMGTRAGLIIGGGFGEGRDTGLRIALQEACQSHGMRICGPNCYGLLNVHSGMAAYSGEIVNPLVPGNIAYVLQSGAMSHALHNTAIGRGTGISHIITSGNEISLEMGDYLEWLVEDPNTSVIALFMEGLKKRDPFVRAAKRALELGKPIVALKVGKSEKGRDSAIAHTGSVAGDDMAFEGLFRQLGIIRVDDVDEFREMLVLLSHGHRPQNSSSALCSISGGITTLLADLAEEVGLELPATSEATRERISEILPEFATVSNPLDTTGSLFEKPEMLSPIADAFLSDTAVCGFGVAFNTPFANASHLARSKVLVDVQKRSEKPVVCFSVSSASVDEKLTAALAEGGIPFLLGARETLLSLKRWGDYHAFRSRHARSRENEAAPAPVASEPMKGLLTESRAIALLSAYGVPFAPLELVRSEEDAVKAATAMGFPVALKIDLEGVAHKTELQGIELGIRNEAELRSTYDKLLRRFSNEDISTGINGVSVQKMVSAGLEVLLGVRADPVLGPQIVVGAGGILVEILRDVALRTVPVSEFDAREMIRETVLSRLLPGFRGSPPFDEDALIKTILALSSAAYAMREDIAEIDINPLIVLPQGMGAFGVDAVVAFKDQERCPE